jgi:hypothetical protein
MSARENTLSCHEAQRLMAFYMKDDPTLSPEEREGFERHLLVCPSCAAEYEQEKRLEVLLEAYWAFARSSQGGRVSARQDRDGNDSRGTSESASEPLSVGAGSERPARSVPRLVETRRRGERKGRLARAAWHAGALAAAASILIAIGINWFVVHKTNTSRRTPMAARTVGSPAGFAELVTADGREPLTLDRPVTTAAQPQEILLGGMHRVVMNRNTRATFIAEPRRTEGPHAGKIPYEIQLAQGELYVEVVPGHPFSVKTVNARLEITGTKFDVVADGDKTELTLLTGSIRFSALDHPHEAVSVTSGHASTVTGRLTPNVPARVDAIATTAWARDVALNNVIALADAHAGVDLSSLSMIGEEYWRYADPPDVDTLDYETWRDTHKQQWFIVAPLTAAKADQTINADWIELLMISGDIWQFAYDPELPADQPLAKIEPAAITRLARYYGLDEKKVLEALGQPESILTTTSSVQDGTPGQRYGLALRRWHDAVVAAVAERPEAKDDPELFSVYASQYLAETRTAAYLWVRNHPEQAGQLLCDSTYTAMLPAPPAVASNGIPDVNAWLKQLHDQANAARSCVPAAMEWLLVPPGTGCAYQATEQQRRLAALLAELAPSPDQPEGMHE